MAAAKKQAAAKPSEGEPQPEPAKAEEDKPAKAEPTFARQVAERGGWNEGLIGKPTDPEPNDVYTVAGQLGSTAKAPKPLEGTDEPHSGVPANKPAAKNE